MAKTIARFVGIDPGRNGAIAVLDSEGNLVSVDDVDTLDADSAGVIISIALTSAKPLGITATAVEQSLPFGPGSKHSMMLQGFGVGVATALATQYSELVLKPFPSVWKKDMELSKDKLASIALAKQLHPELATEQLRADQAEAILLAEWCFIQYRDNNNVLQTS